MTGPLYIHKDRAASSKHARRGLAARLTPLNYPMTFPRVSLKPRYRPDYPEGPSLRSFQLLCHGKIALSSVAEDVFLCNYMNLWVFFLH
jgi:hypothetical protein